MSIKKGLAVLALLGSGAAAHAQPAAPDGALAACSTIENRRSRLDCYDAMSHMTPRAPQAGAPTPPSASPAPPPPGSSAPSEEPSFNTGRRRGHAAPAAAAAAAGNDSFGLDTVRQPARARGKRGGGEMEAQVVSASDTGIGHWTIALSSGAVWQMTENVPGFRPPSAGASVTLRHGRFGGYFMDVDHQAGVRVSRLR